MKQHCKNKCKKACRHATFSSTFLTALFHFVFCGLPAIVALLGAIFGLSSIPSMNFLTTTQRTNLLIVGAILLVISFVAYHKEKKICDDPKMMYWEKIILFTSLGFFGIGVIFHLISIAVLTTPACH